MNNAVKGVKGFVSMPLEERFWEKVQKDVSCWIWQGSVKNRERPYGEFWVDGRLRPASQVAWELHHGEPFPEGKMACHVCDNERCVNPHHIFPGTMSDNIRDSMSKGRSHSPRLRELQEENKRYREALEWYAARSTGEPCWHSGTVSVIHLDGGQVARDALAGGSDPLERLREHNRVSPAIFAEVAGGSVQESGCSETDSGWYWNKVEEVKKPVHEPCPVCGAIGNPRLQCDTCVAAMAQTCNHLWQKGSELCTRCGAKREYSDCDL